MLTLEFHCHTIFSQDSLLTPQKLIEICRRRGIDRVVITDHNTIAGALAAQKLDPERPPTIAPGREPRAKVAGLRRGAHGP